MRWLMATAALLAANPAQAQEAGLPMWLVGTWCGAMGASQEGHTPPQACDTWVAAGDGTLRDRFAPEKGTPTKGPQEEGVMTLDQGRLVLRGGSDGANQVDFHEVSRGPGSVVFENRMDGLVTRLALRREGDDLIEDIWIKDRDAPQRSVYHLKR